ncbi:MAG: hypothetical protein WA981_09800 [Glaciecola sp.]
MKQLLVNVSRSMVLGSVLVAAPFSALACDYHDQPSFGAFGSMGGFSGNHPLMQRHLSASKAPKMRISHDSVVQSKLAETDSVDITYYIPATYKNASLRFTHSDGVEIDNNTEIQIDELKGTYTLNYVAREAGKQHILIWADATQQKLPMSVIQRIDIQVQ